MTICNIFNQSDYTTEYDDIQRLWNFREITIDERQKREHKLTNKYLDGNLKIKLYDKLIEKSFSLKTKKLENIEIERGDTISYGTLDGTQFGIVKDIIIFSSCLTWRLEYSLIVKKKNGNIVEVTKDHCIDLVSKSIN